MSCNIGAGIFLISKFPALHFIPALLTALSYLCVTYMSWIIVKVLIFTLNLHKSVYSVRFHQNIYSNICCAQIDLALDCFSHFSSKSKHLYLSAVWKQTFHWTVYRGFIKIYHSQLYVLLVR